MNGFSPSKFQQILNRSALIFLRGLRVFSRAGLIIGKPAAKVLAGFGGFAVRWLILPAYKLVIITRLRLTRLLLSARGIVFLLVTNRYVFHTALVLIVALTIGTQLRAKSATATEGQSSLLYALVTQGQDEIVEEEANPELLTKNANYLGADTIQGVPDVDYDYRDEDLPFADLALPGAIAVQPGSEEPGIPGEAILTRTQTESYTVQSGDTVASIARRFGVNVGTIVFTNNLGRAAFIKPGDTLRIPPVSGLLHVVKKGDTVEKIAKNYDASAEEILSVNRLAPNHTLALGEELVIPGGTPPAAPVTAKHKPTVATRPNVPISRIRNKTVDIYQESTKTDTRAKPKNAAEDDAKPKAKLLWPTTGRAITQYYGWKHTGVDIDGDYVDPIYASADGVVEKAGWNNGGYGLQVLIDHQNGYKTRYAHASKLFVSAGNKVKRGQVIAMIGTTGRSTGTHVHFEVYVNNKRVNPLAYTK